MSSSMFFSSVATLFVMLFVIDIVDSTHFRGGSFRFNVLNLQTCDISLYTEEVMESEYYMFPQNCHKETDTLYTMEMKCSGCSLDAFNMLPGCSNWKPNETVSIMHAQTKIGVSCTGLSLIRYAKCCWIRVPHWGPLRSYEMVLQIANLKRLDNQLNRSPIVFVPPVLRVGTNRKESFQMFMSDPDGDKITCHQPDVQRDCYHCDWIDNINPQIGSYVKIHEDCTFSTDFPVAYNDLYYTLVLAVQEMDKDDHTRMLSRSTVVTLLHPAVLPCESRASVHIKIDPNHKLFLPGVKYTITAKSKAPCSKANITKIIFSLKPEGAKMTIPQKVGDLLTQAMEFEVSDQMCKDMIPICTYSLDNHEIQGEPKCHNFECKGYRSLTEAEINKRKQLIGGVSGLLGLLALTGLMGGLAYYKYQQSSGDGSDSSMSSEGSSEESTESTSVPEKLPPSKPKAPAQRSVAMSSVDFDDE